MSTVDKLPFWGRTDERPDRKKGRRKEKGRRKREG
jgi:hypothetical protein